MEQEGDGVIVRVPHELAMPLVKYKVVLITMALQVLSNCFLASNGQGQQNEKKQNFFFGRNLKKVK